MGDESWLRHTFIHFGNEISLNFHALITEGHLGSSCNRAARIIALYSCCSRARRSESMLYILSQNSLRMSSRFSITIDMNCVECVE